MFDLDPCWKNGPRAPDDTASRGRGRCHAELPYTLVVVAPAVTFGCGFLLLAE